MCIRDSLNNLGKTKEELPGPEAVLENRSSVLERLWECIGASVQPLRIYQLGKRGWGQSFALQR